VRTAFRAAGQEPPADFIRHDYALLTVNRETREEEYRPIIPQGTRYPTRPDFYTYEVTPVCPRGMPQEVFELIICELGRGHGGHREFFWDARGEMHVIEAGNTGKPIARSPINPKSEIGTASVPYATSPPHQQNTFAPRVIKSSPTASMSFEHTKRDVIGSERTP
jgi:hypothetical protein